MFDPGGEYCRDLVGTCGEGLMCCNHDQANFINVLFVSAFSDQLFFKIDLNHFFREDHTQLTCAAAGQ